MEILFKGTIPSERELEGECYYCGTRVRFKVGEGKTTYDQRDGDYVTVTCPVCSHNISVEI